MYKNKIQTAVQKVSKNTAGKRFIAERMNPERLLNNFIVLLKSPDPILREHHNLLHPGQILFRLKYL